MNIKQLICEEIVKPSDRDARFKSDDVWIRCPYHGGGNERTGSLRIRLGSDYKIGSWKCFGCKKWSSDWNELAKVLKLKQTKLADQSYTAGDFSFEEAEYTESLPVLQDLHPWPLEEAWRTITGETIQLLKGRMLFYRNKLMLYLPVFSYGEYVGGIRCELVVTDKLKDEGQKSYVNTTGIWSRMNLFGFDIARKRSGPLWVVEGPRDVAKIVQCGGRAVGLIGSYVGPSKLRLIESLDPPMVIIATDPDDAGNGAANELENGLKYIPTIRVNFPKGKDPANFTPKSYQKITERLMSH